jgi:hypothetical protein
VAATLEEMRLDRALRRLHRAHHDEAVFRRHRPSQITDAQEKGGYDPGFRTRNSSIKDRVSRLVFEFFRGSSPVRGLIIRIFEYQPRIEFTIGSFSRIEDYPCKDPWYSPCYLIIPWNSRILKFKDFKFKNWLNFEIEILLVEEAAEWNPPFPKPTHAWIMAAEKEDFARLTSKYCLLNSRILFKQLQNHWHH